MVLIDQQSYDRNSNEFPPIYIGAIDSESDEHISTQINNKLQHLWNVNFNGIPTSSYFDLCQYTQRLRIRKATDRIRRDMKPTRSGLPMENRPKLDGVVFIWNIDDITMLSTDHFAELDILRPDIDLKSLTTLQNQILSNSNFTTVRALERRSVLNIEQVLSGEKEEFERYTEKYKKLKELYERTTCDIKHVGPTNCHGLLESMQMGDNEEEIKEAAKQHQDIFNNRWKSAKKCIELVNKRSSRTITKTYKNVVISRHGVAKGAAQLIVSGLSSSIPIENIYSIHQSSQYPVLQQIKQRFGENCCYIYVSTTDRQAYSAFDNINDWPIYANESVNHLYDFMKCFLLKSFALEPYTYNRSSNPRQRTYHNRHNMYF